MERPHFLPVCSTDDRKILGSEREGTIPTRKATSRLYEEASRCYAEENSKLQGHLCLRNLRTRAVNFANI